METAVTAETSVTYLYTRLHGVIFQKTLVIIFIAMRASDLRPEINKYPCGSPANVTVIRVRMLAGTEVTLCRLFGSAFEKYPAPYPLGKRVKATGGCS
jgi:hypothetical protein